MKRPLAPARTDPRSTNESFKKEALEALLKQHFGYSEFRGKQFDAIEAVLSGRDCFCLMPTGGGKSMCFQIPALAKPGVVLVVSPLIALMENQVTTLKQKGIPAEFLSSTQTAGTREKIHEDLNSGKPSVRLLYVTPELIATFGFMTKITKLYHRGLLSLIAIDEAHCISTWGHDFRPSYRKLSSLRSRLPDVPILALTATAVPKVQMDVMKSLCLQDPLILRASFNRPNIFYEVRYKDLLQDAYTDLSDLLKSCGNVCSIVYCLERSACDDLANHLLKEGISSAAYHAGLNNKLRSTVLDDWLSAKIQVVVATVAFGMGIDRKDVRVVLHFNIPKSMEAFYQESGRAGRDQLPSRSVLYYGIDDRKKMEFILKNSSRKKTESSSSAGELKKTLADFDQMVEYCENSGCRRKKILESFGEVVSASFCHKSCDACKNPNLVTANLEEVKRIPSNKYGLPPIFAKSSSDATFVGGDSEFWNRDDEASSPDEEISDSDDEAEAMCNLVKSKMPTKSRLHEKYEVLKRAEELYYQKEDKRKQSSSVVEKNAVTETLREAGGKRLSSALKQAHERLGTSLSNSEASVKFLETECFKKYGKVGKTFYNSQLAATVRWLSSATHEQLQDRLSADPALATSHCSVDSLPDVFALPPRDPHEEITTRSETTSVDTRGNARIEDPCVPVQMATTMEKQELPPIPSFSEFVNKGRSQHSSGGIQKRRADSDGRGRMQPEKRMKQ